ncbi:MAG TPA: helix-turn-helix domain-containing protein [Pirellulaceae bacterium]|nr:helix-turn-helix domain-containing protein [Pirellulaceae bacterium]
MTAPVLVSVPVADLAEFVARAQARWLTIDRAADYSSLSAKSLRRMLSSGSLTAHRPCKGRVLIDRLELDSVIGAATAQPRKGRGIDRGEMVAAAGAG